MEAKFFLAQYLMLIWGGKAQSCLINKKQIGTQEQNLLVC